MKKKKKKFDRTPSNAAAFPAFPTLIGYKNIQLFPTAVVCFNRLIKILACFWNNFERIRKLKKNLFSSRSFRCPNLHIAVGNDCRRFHRRVPLDSLPSERWSIGCYIWMDIL